MTWLIDLFRVLTACTSLTMMLSPSVVIYQVLKTRKTGVTSIYPMVATLGNTHAWMMWGYMDKNFFPIFSTYVVGELALLTFLAIYYKFTPDKAYAHKCFLYFGIAIVIASCYAILGGLGYTGQTRHEVSNFLGYIGILGALAMYTSPFEKLRMVLKHRSGVFIPIHMTFAGAINNATFMSYCYLTKTWILFVPNSFFLCMAIIQASLYFVYHPSTHPYHAPALDHEEDLEASKDDQRDHSVVHGAFVAVHSPLAPLHAASTDK